jgi:succinyl-diaminopimelate desuccinylase
MKQHFDAWVDAHGNEIIAETQAVLRIPSVEEPETADKAAGAPFGKPLADALAHTLALCERLGMKTENFGGYAGHAEFGQGEQIVAMLGHLMWFRPAAGGRRSRSAHHRDGRLYARGASDDKGPTYAALFGAKASRRDAAQGCVVEQAHPANFWL